MYGNLKLFWNKYLVIEKNHPFYFTKKDHLHWSLYKKEPYVMGRVLADI